MEQKKLIDELFDITRYIYNKANSLVKSKKFSWKNFIGLRDYLVTRESKKPGTSKRKDFELEASDSTRQCAVQNLCDAYKTATANLKAGNIRAFNVSYKKKNEPRQCLELGSRDLQMTNRGFKIYPKRWKGQEFLKISKKDQIKYGNCKVDNNCDLLRQKGNYYICIVLPQVVSENKTFNRICGIDLGLRTLASAYTPDSVVEYTTDTGILKQMNKKLDSMRNSVKRIKKKALNKIEKQKIDFTDNLHWNLIKEILDQNDVVFIGDIKSHDITKNGKNKHVNRLFNDLKFYIFKSRLLYKAKTRNKKVFMINEAYTTQCCSNCGDLLKTIGSNKIYECSKCNFVCDRDLNSAKNIFMRGIISYL